MKSIDKNYVAFAICSNSIEPCNACESLCLVVGL